MADAARSYTIVLKDAAELSVSLVAVSQAHDLALPKFNDIKRPA